MTDGNSLPRLRRLRRAAVVLAMLAGIAPTTRAQDPPKRAPTRQSNLVGSYPPFFSAVLDGNRVLCGVDNQGHLCGYDLGPYGGGGFWPGTPNEYVFGSGLQIAAIVAADGGPWAGDTVGAYYFDARGTQPQGQQVTDIYSSTAPDHLAVWPANAVIRDPQLFDPSYLGRRAISAEDSWVRYWDGPRLLSGREHGMGVLVEQRSLQFGYPVGNEDILYWVFTLTNITASDPAAYAGLDPAIRDEVAALGAQWVAETEARVGVNLPPGGVRFDSLYVGLGMDADVGNAGANFSTTLLPFDASVSYKSDFHEGPWRYPLEIAAPPFGPRPGFVGTALLRTPPAQTTGVPPGMSVFSTMTGSSQFPFPTGVTQLWRYLSMNLSSEEGDAICDVTPPKERRLCTLVQVPSDTRFFQSTGPFALGPGESIDLVMAYVFAGAVDSVVAPYVGGVLPPGIPPSGPDLAAGRDTIRTIDRAAGWLTHTDANGDGDITPDEVQTVPRSLLAKVQLARALAAHGFLLPTAPAAPEFFLVPDDNRVTVVWKPSDTEATGDPYFALASDPTSGLWDPDFRQFDVEGYRIYRGRRPDQLELLAQFDYQGTTFVDYTGALDYGQGCAPELGVTDRCPTFPVTRVLDGGLTQVPPGGRVLVGDNLVVIHADTVRGLAGTGVPFGFIDTGVQNFYPYYYAVTAFDVNSIASGPSSLESPIIAKSVVPRATSTQVQTGVLQPMELVGADGTVLDRNQALPTIDPASGKFSGPMPPTDGWTFEMSAFLPAVLGDDAADLVIDSVTPGDAFGGTYGDIHYYMTASGSAGTVQVEIPGFHNAYSSGVSSSSATFPLVAFDGTKAGLYGGDASYQLSAGTEVEVEGAYRLGSWGRGDINGDPGGGITVHAGPRWFSGDNETEDDPNGGFSSPSNSYAGTDQTWTDLSHTAGELPGVDLVWRPASYSTADYLFRYVESITSTVYRAADFEVIWGADGAVASVTDLTHHVPVDFNAGIRASWGILTDASFASVNESDTNDKNNGLLTWADVLCLPEITRSRSYSGMCNRTSTPAHFVNTATLSPISDGTSGFGNANTLTPSGDGFIFYINGHFFLMRMTALPAEGTSWKVRFFAGYIRGTPDGNDYEFGSATRPPAVPGLTARLNYTGTSLAAEITDSMLANVHTVPDPFYVTSHLGDSPAQRVLKFVNLPDRAIIRIYSLSGVLVTVLEHDDPSLGGEATWDLRNRNGRVVASGVYFYHVETPDGAEKIGRMTLVVGGSYAIPRE